MASVSSAMHADMCDCAAHGNQSYGGQLPSRHVPLADHYKRDHTFATAHDIWQVRKLVYAFPDTMTPADFEDTDVMMLYLCWSPQMALSSRSCAPGCSSKFLLCCCREARCAYARTKGWCVAALILPRTRRAAAVHCASRQRHPFPQGVSLPCGVVLLPYAAVLLPYAAVLLPYHGVFLRCSVVIFPLWWCVFLTLTMP